MIDRKPDTAGMLAMYEAAKIRATELGIVVMEEKPSRNWATGTTSLRVRFGLYGPPALFGAYDNALLKNYSDCSGPISVFVEKVAEASRIVESRQYAYDLIEAGAYDVYGEEDEKKLRALAAKLEPVRA
jgi:hypothetical protein